MIQQLKNSKIYLSVYFLIFILPFLPLVREIFPVGFGEEYTLVGFVKEMIVLFFATMTLAYLSEKGREMRINGAAGVLVIFFFYGFSHLFLTSAIPSNALNNFRLVYLNVALASLIILLFLNSGFSPDCRKIVRLIFYSALVVAAFGLYEKFINPDIIGLYKLSYPTVVKNLGIPGFPKVRIAATMANPIKLGLFLVVASICCIYLIETASRRIFSFLFFFSLLVFGFVLIFTLSRTAYGSFFIVLCMYIIFKMSDKDRPLKKVLLSLFLFSIIGLLTWVAASKEGTILLRLAQTMDTETFMADPRHEKWGLIIKDLSENLISLLWGFGLGNSGTSGLSGNYIIVENSFLSILVELGLFGICFYLYVIARYSFNAGRLLKSQRKEKKNLGRLLFMYLAVFLFSSFFVDSYLNHPFSVYFWLLFAVSETEALKNNAV